MTEEITNRQTAEEAAGAIPAGQPTSTVGTSPRPRSDLTASRQAFALRSIIVPS